MWNTTFAFSAHDFVISIQMTDLRGKIKLKAQGDVKTMTMPEAKLRP